MMLVDETHARHERHDGIVSKTLSLLFTIVKLRMEDGYSRGDSLWFLDVNVNFVTSRLRHRARLRGKQASPANRKYPIRTNGLANRLFRHCGIAPEEACSSSNEDRMLIATMTLNGSLVVTRRTLPSSLFPEQFLDNVCLPSREMSLNKVRNVTN